MYVGGGCVLGKVLSPAEPLVFFVLCCFCSWGRARSRSDARIHAIIGVLCLVEGICVYARKHCVSCSERRHSRKQRGHTVRPFRVRRNAQCLKLSLCSREHAAPGNKPARSDTGVRAHGPQQHMIRGKVRITAETEQQ